MLLASKVLFALVAATLGLVLILRQLEHDRRDVGYTTERLSDTRKVCTDLHGSEQEKAQRLSHCNRQCLEHEVITARGSCLANCQKEANALGRCLIERTTARP